MFRHYVANAQCANLLKKQRKFHDLSRAKIIANCKAFGCKGFSLSTLATSNFQSFNLKKAARTFCTLHENHEEIMRKPS